MRALTSSEKKLGIAFGVLALIALNLVVMRWLSVEIGSTRGRLAEIKSEVTALRTMALERPYWETRGAWLAGNSPKTYDGQSTDSEFAEKIQRETRQFGLAIENQQLLVAEPVGDWVVTPMDLTLRGNLESVVRWLQSVQGAGKFMEVENFNLRQSDDAEGMILRVRLRQLFRNASSTGGEA